jgi:hypothetical protein
MGRKGEWEKGRKKIKVKRIKTKVFYIFAVPFTFVLDTED